MGTLIFRLSFFRRYIAVKNFSEEVRVNENNKRKSDHKPDEKSISKRKIVKKSDEHKCGCNSNHQDRIRQMADRHQKSILQCYFDRIIKSRQNRKYIQKNHYCEENGHNHEIV